jgi:hypothetical protein
MWLFTTFGFFSVTQTKEDPELLQVRARVREDLDLLRNTYLPELTETVELKARDYPYRGYTDRSCLSAAMVQIVHDITYSNFKSQVIVEQGLPREILYARVWTVMNNAETKLADIEDEEERRARTWDLKKLEARYTTGPFPVVVDQTQEFFDEDSTPMMMSLLGDPELESVVFPKRRNRKRKGRKTR